MAAVSEITLRSAGKRFEKSLPRLNESLAKKMVIYKDDDVIALNKPPGLAVHGSAKKDEQNDLLSRLGYWQYDKPRPPGLGHRIDKNTTGVLLLTRHAAAARRIRKMFEERKITKKYWAITIDVPSESKGSITIPLGRKNIATKRQHTLHRVILRTDKADLFSEDKAGSRHLGDLCLAWTDYSVISTHHERCALVDIDLRTGFKHQIRAHLADGLGCPVLGDYLFAGPLFRKDRSLAEKMKSIAANRGYSRGPVYLHAYEIIVPREEGEPLVINAPLPEYFKKAINGLDLHVPAKYKKLLFK